MGIKNNAYNGIDYFREAEQVLYKVRVFDESIVNLTKRRERAVKRGAPKEPGGVDFSKPYTKTHYVNDTLNEMLEIVEINGLISVTEEKRAEIFDALDGLTAEHKKILTMWYIEQKTKEKIAEVMHIESMTTIYSLRNKAMLEFSIRYFGAAALGSRR